jgi:hypothetical protein
MLALVGQINDNKEVKIECKLKKEVNIIVLLLYNNDNNKD